MTKLTTDQETQLTEYLKYEILAGEYFATERYKQAEYCEAKSNECFNALKRLFDDPIAAINDFSENNYTAIERKVLRLDNYGALPTLEELEQDPLKICLVEA
jgi:hypothetical protein